MWNLVREELELVAPRQHRTNILSDWCICHLSICSADQYYTTHPYTKRATKIQWLQTRMMYPSYVNIDKIIQIMEHSRILRQRRQLQNKKKTSAVRSRNMYHRWSFKKLRNSRVTWCRIGVSPEHINECSVQLFFPYSIYQVQSSDYI